MTAVNGCTHCGKAKREHGIEWAPRVGYHTWEEPTNRQRLERFRAARAAEEGKP